MTSTLKSLFDQCAQLKNPRLEFLPADFGSHREIILRDLNELRAAALAGHEKTVVVLAGSLIEAVLYCFLQTQQEYISTRRGVEFQFNPGHTLEKYVRVFNRYFSDVVPNVPLPDVVVRYRNLVHIDCEIDSPSGTGTIASRELLQMLEGLLAGLAEFSEGAGSG